MPHDPMTPARFCHSSLDRRPGPRYCIQPDWIGKRRLVTVADCGIAVGWDINLAPHHAHGQGVMAYDVKERNGLWYLCDCFITTKPLADFRERFLNPVRDAIDRNPDLAQCVVETRLCETLDDIDAHRRDFATTGYCAAVLRHGGSPYRPGKTCASALRLCDEKTMVVRIEAVTAGHAGMAVLQCRAEPAAPAFSCFAPGSIQTKQAIADAPGDFIGRGLLVKFTKTGEHGAPLYPIAVEFTS